MVDKNGIILVKKNIEECDYHLKRLNAEIKYLQENRKQWKLLKKAREGLLAQLST